MDFGVFRVANFNASLFALLQASRPSIFDERICYSSKGKAAMESMSIGVTSSTSLWVDEDRF